MCSATASSASCATACRRRSAIWSTSRWCERTTRTPGALEEVLKNGLKSLDGWQERSPVKTHFVLIDYSGVHYEIQARQFDGLTGQPSPLVRRDQTRDPEFVAKAAALIEQDFGFVGVFDRWPTPLGEARRGPAGQPAAEGRRPRRAAGPLDREG